VISVATSEPEFLGRVTDVNLSLIRVVSSRHIAKFEALSDGIVRQIILLQESKILNGCVGDIELSSVKSIYIVVDITLIITRHKLG
jgi:hypothetical protein